MCYQRGPTEGDFKKWRSHPQGLSAATIAFVYFWRFSKSESYCQGLASKTGMDAKPIRHE
jgi:hypothetical protein